jgi:hypothetical protein
MNFEITITAHIPSDRHGELRRITKALKDFATAINATEDSNGPAAFDPVQAERHLLEDFAISGASGKNYGEMQEANRAAYGPEKAKAAVLYRSDKGFLVYNNENGRYVLSAAGQSRLDQLRGLATS